MRNKYGFSWVELAKNAFAFFLYDRPSRSFISLFHIYKDDCYELENSYEFWWGQHNRYRNFPHKVAVFRRATVFFQPPGKLLTHR